MLSPDERKRIGFPVTTLLDFERELLLKHIDGYLLGRIEKAQLEKLLKRLRGRG